MVRRLTQIAVAELEAESGISWSAGIVELPASTHNDRIANLSRFAAAQTALRQAREAGGGIRIAALA